MTRQTFTQVLRNITTSKCCNCGLFFYRSWSFDEIQFPSWCKFVQDMNYLVRTSWKHVITSWSSMQH